MSKGKLKDWDCSAETLGEASGIPTGRITEILYSMLASGDLSLFADVFTVLSNCEKKLKAKEVTPREILVLSFLLGRYIESKCNRAERVEIVELNESNKSEKLPWNHTQSSITKAAGIDDTRISELIGLLIRRWRDGNIMSPSKLLSVIEKMTESDEITLREALVLIYTVVRYIEGLGFTMG